MSDSNWIYWPLAAFYVVVCLFLILVVLVQEGKGGMGSAFGGSSQTVFGGAGAGNVLTRATSVAAALFMILSATLAYLSSRPDAVLEERARQHEVEEANRRELRESADRASSAPSSGEASDEGGASALTLDLGGDPSGEDEEPAAPPEAEPSQDEGAPSPGEEPAPSPVEERGAAEQPTAAPSAPPSEAPSAEPTAP